jgi:uncharacterized membrane protein YbhN (UPF0104 family)
VKKNWIQLTVSTLLIMILGAWLASRAEIEPSEVGRAIVSVGWKAFFLAFLCHFIQISLVILRYHLLAPREIHPGFRRLSYAIGIGHALNTYFPARLGDVLKCFFLSQGSGNRMTALSGAGLVVADRLLDVSMLLLMAVLWRPYEHPRMKEWLSTLPLHLGWGIVGLGVVAVFLVWFFFLRGKTGLAARWTGEFRDGTLGLTRPGPVLLGAALAIVAWGAEVTSIQILAASQGVSLTFSNCLFVILWLNFAISLPLSLANLGPFEAAIALTLATFGMDSNSAFAVATVQHGVQLLVVACFAGMAMVVRPRDPKPPSVSGS